MNKILVPTDFSEQAENALKVAAKLAKKHNSEIYLLHIVDMPLQEKDPVNTTVSASGPEAIFFMKLAHKRFQDLISKDFLEGITLHEVVHFQEIHKGIDAKCKKHDIDLVVMGSNGASGLTEILIGSNTEKVVRNSETPVLVIKEADESFEINNIVFASDLSIESKSTYQKAIDFAKKSNAKIHLLLVNTPSQFTSTDDANKNLKLFADEFDFDNYTLNFYSDLTIEKGIMNFSNKISADLIAMSTQKKGISHFFNGSVSSDLVNHAKRPIMTFKI